MALQRSLYRLAFWCRWLLCRDQLERELDDEISYHVQANTEENIAKGMTPQQARRAARLELGGVEQIRERVRAARMGAWFETLVRDVRFGLRVLRKSPGFAAAAVVTLALGVGGTTAIFTLVQQVTLRSLPVAQPGQLWRIGDAVRCCYSDGYSQGDGNGLPQNDWSLFSWQAYKLFRANTPAFEQLAAFQIGAANAHLGVRRAGSAAAPVATANGEYVSGNFFETFGISTWRGRLFTEADDREGAPPVAVRSEEHTSELQSLTNLVCRLLLEKKKKHHEGTWRSA